MHRRERSWVGFPGRWPDRWWPSSLVGLTPAFDASWYSDWLINLSKLPSLLGAKPVRSELTYLLVSLNKDYTASQPGEPWETYYAQRIVDHFSSPER